MRKKVRNQVRGSEPNPYATRQDFINVFQGERHELYQLSFLLTGDHEKAEKCFVDGIDNCVRGNRVFREWARIWAKRIIIENAIREQRPRPSFARASIAGHFTHSEESNGSGGHFDLDEVLRLGDFERFVFVMSVLEHYSHHECALLLGCSVWDVRGAGLHALEQLVGSSPAVSYAL